MSALRIFAILAVLACVANQAWALPVGEISAEPEPIVAEASNLDYVDAVPISLLDVDGDASYAVVDGEPSADSNVAEVQRSTRGLGLGLLGAKFGGLGFGLPFKGLGLGGLGFGHGLGGFGAFKPLFYKFG